MGSSGKRRKKRRPVDTGLLFKFRTMDDAKRFASGTYGRARVYVNKTQEPYVAVDGFKSSSIDFIKNVASRMGGSLKY